MPVGVVSPAACDALRAAVLGPVLLPGDEQRGPVPPGARSDRRLDLGAGYEDAWLPWNSMFDPRPGVIVQCMGVADVQAAIAFARANDLLIAVWSGGHSISGASSIDGGMLIDMGLMRGVRVDPVRGSPRPLPGPCSPSSTARRRCMALPARAEWSPTRALPA